MGGAVWPAHPPGPELEKDTSASKHVTWGSTATPASSLPVPFWNQIDPLVVHAKVTLGDPMLEH